MADRGDDAVVAVVVEWKRLGIAFKPVDLDVGLGTAFARDRDQTRRKVQARHSSSQLGRGDGGVACTAGDIKHFHSRLDARPSHDDIADGGHFLRNGPVVAGSPHVIRHG
jgi:hypothetical protein